MILLLSWKLGVRGFREDEKEERKGSDDWDWWLGFDNWGWV